MSMSRSMFKYHILHNELQNETMNFNLSLAKKHCYTYVLYMFLLDSDLNTIV